jgi:hypothetical protein
MITNIHKDLLLDIQPILSKANDNFSIAYNDQDFISEIYCDGNPIVLSDNEMEKIGNFVLGHRPVMPIGDDDCGHYGSFNFNMKTKEVVVKYHRKRIITDTYTKVFELCPYSIDDCLNIIDSLVRVDRLNDTEMFNLVLFRIWLKYSKIVKVSKSTLFGMEIHTEPGSNVILEKIFGFEFPISPNDLAEALISCHEDFSELDKYMPPTAVSRPDNVIIEFHDFVDNLCNELIGHANHVNHLISSNFYL